VYTEKKERNIYIYIYIYMFVFVLAVFCWTKSLLCIVAAFIGMLFISESSRYSECISLI
jgi:hypothetical protein